jgi:basic membrane lipoprotein Med (substrate-binding protein (PBP1-ABC) superfamily)
MTMPTAHLLVRTPRRGLRAHPLLVAIAVALAALATIAASAPVAPTATVAPPRVALVVDAGARPDAALARAAAVARAAERSGTATVSVRVPRTSAEAAADVRYFAAQRVVDRVVTVGPVAGAAAREAGFDYPGARFSALAAVPGTLR